MVLLELSLSEASSELYGKPEEFYLEFDLPVRLDKALDLVNGVRVDPDESESCESPRKEAESVRWYDIVHETTFVSELPEVRPEVRPVVVLVAVKPADVKPVVVLSLPVDVNGVQRRSPSISGS